MVRRNEPFVVRDALSPGFQERWDLAQAVAPLVAHRNVSVRVGGRRALGAAQFGTSSIRRVAVREFIDRLRVGLPSAPHNEEEEEI